MRFEPAAAASVAAAAFGRSCTIGPLAASAQPPFAMTPARRSFVHLSALALVWITIFSGFLVVKEPAPFDVLMLGLVLLLPVIGLTAINSAHLVYLILWLIVIATGFLATGAAVDPDAASLHIAVTLYLALASFIIAAFVARRPEAHSRLIFRAYVAAAVLASLLGILGYFDAIPGAKDLFVVHWRASGTFKDPNVFAAFLVPPVIYLLHETLSRRVLGTLRATIALAIISVALLLSFSRGAWLNLAVALLVYWPLAFVTARTDRQRARLFGLSVLLAAVAGLAVLLALQSDAVAKLFTMRAAMDQSYDMGPEGRFGGQLKAIALILEHPFGIGALQFGGIHHPEHPHNVYLTQFLNGGWIGGFAYIIIIVATVVAMFRSVLRRSWATRTQLVILAAAAGLIVEGYIVETDHWRTFFIVMGLAWGAAFPTLGEAPARAARIVASAAERSGAMPLRPPRRAPRIVSVAPTLRMSSSPPARRRRRRQPKRRSRLVVH